jgi:hypothetical protein
MKLPDIDDKTWLPGPREHVHIFRHYKQRQFETCISIVALDLSMMTDVDMYDETTQDNVEYARIKTDSRLRHQCIDVLTTRAEAARLCHAWMATQ